MTIIIKNKDTLLIDEFKFKCCIGKNGIKKNKIEGDLSTPKGNFGLEDLYYRKDKLSKPITRLQIKEIKRNFGWCTDNKSNLYNISVFVYSNTSFRSLTRLTFVFHTWTVANVTFSVLFGEEIKMKTHSGRRREGQGRRLPSPARGSRNSLPGWRQRRPHGRQ